MPFFANLQLLFPSIRSLLTHTEHAFVELFDAKDTTHLPIFRLHLCLEDEGMIFFPSVGDLESSLEFVIDTIAGSFQNISRIEVAYYMHTQCVWILHIITYTYAMYTAVHALRHYMCM